MDIAPASERLLELDLRLTRRHSAVKARRSASTRPEWPPEIKRQRGVGEINNWNDQSYDEGIRTTTVRIEDHCLVELEMHYYEKNGGARVSYDWERVGDL